MIAERSFHYQHLHETVEVFESSQDDGGANSDPEELFYQQESIEPVLECHWGYSFNNYCWQHPLAGAETATEKWGG